MPAGSWRSRTWRQCGIYRHRACVNVDNNVLVISCQLWRMKLSERARSLLGARLRGDYACLDRGLGIEGKRRELMIAVNIFGLRSLKRE
jgi:hypothetical protein